MENGRVPLGGICSKCIYDVLCHFNLRISANIKFTVEIWDCIFDFIYIILFTCFGVKLLLHFITICKAVLFLLGYKFVIFFQDFLHPQYLHYTHVYEYWKKLCKQYLLRSKIKIDFMNLWSNFGSLMCNGMHLNSLVYKIVA